MSRQIYLDYAAATPVDPGVLAAMQPYFSERFFNPSAPYEAARQVSADIQGSRERVAHWLGARPSDIYFIGGATEANNLVISGVLDTYPDGEVVALAIEHDAVLGPAQAGGRATLTAVTPDGVADLESLERSVSDKTVLVSVMYANNEIGTVQPLRRIAQMLEPIRKQRKRDGNVLPLYLHTDASQAANYLDLHVSRLGVELMTLNGGKMYGPKGAGVLYVASHVKLQPQILGGGQERGLRSGTENVPNIIGFSAALDLVQQSRREESARLAKLQSLFVAGLASAVPAAVINGSLKNRLPNNVHATFPGQDNERLQILLDQQGILCATGSACSASKEQASHVLAAIGMDENSSRAALRFTLGRATTEKDIVRTLEALKSIAR